ncbi:hypothetical protein J6590_044924 [Homalodisca vitripennis]|nr:hypothetical protein J6590_044924 [Homalodisca vitripennis]
MYSEWGTGQDKPTPGLPTVQRPSCKSLLKCQPDLRRSSFSQTLKKDSFPESLFVKGSLVVKNKGSVKEFMNAKSLSAVQFKTHNLTCIFSLDRRDVLYHIPQALGLHLPSQASSYWGQIVTIDCQLPALSLAVRQLITPHRASFNI